MFPTRPPVHLVPEGVLTDEDVLFLTDALPTGWWVFSWQRQSRYASP